MSLIQQTPEFFQAHRLLISSTKSKIIHHDSNQDGLSFPDIPCHPPLSLDAVLSYKYLGVVLNSSSRAMFKDHNAAAVKRAKMFMSRALYLTRTGPCRSLLLHRLWTCVALPSILYGCEVAPLTKESIRVITVCQNTVGRSILGLAKYASNAAVSQSGRVTLPRGPG